MGELKKLDMEGLKLSDLKNNMGEAMDKAGLAMSIVQFVAKMLPSRKQKRFIDAMKFGAVGAIYNAIKGRKYTSGEYVLGERFVKQILGEKLKSRNDVQDIEVPTAKIFFTFAFGVRITTSQDLDALDGGIEAYYKRPEKKDIPRKAVERAVFLKKNYYMISTYNKQAWDLSHFDSTPYTARIPGIMPDTFLTADISPEIRVLDGNIIGSTNFEPEPTSEFDTVPVPEPKAPAVPVLGGVPFDTGQDEESFRDGEVKELETVTFVQKFTSWRRANKFLTNVLLFISLLVVGTYFWIWFQKKRKKG